MLEVKSLSRHFGSVKAVDQVNFRINKGEIVGLLGQNGAGKTTIMKMISGFLEPDQGTVVIHGVQLDHAINTVQSGLGYLPENLPIYPEMTVSDYLDFVAELKGLKGYEKIKEIQRVIASTHLSEKLPVPIATLSRGFKQRVGVAQALIGRPKLLILDEPTNGLDPEQTEHMRTLIRQIAKDATVILSTHIMQEVEALCSRVLILHKGKLALDAPLDELKQSRHILLETTLPEEDSEILTSIDGICSIDTVTSRIDVVRYKIEIRQEIHHMRICATIAARMIAAGHQVYRLQPEIRTLETLFREVNANPFEKEAETDVA